MIRFALPLLGGLLLLLTIAECAPEKTTKPPATKGTPKTDDLQTKGMNKHQEAFEESLRTINCNYLDQGALTGVKGKIKVGTRAGNYSNDQYCQWDITVDDGFIIKLKFKWFELEGSYSGCPYDYVNIVDLETGDSLTGGVLCDEVEDVEAVLGVGKFPWKVKSTGNSVRVIFSTDGSVTRYGFKIKWKRE